MPQIFDEVARETMRQRLLDNGFTLIKQHGLRKTSVGDVAKSAGIATGTFYNFFKTKEEFVYQIVLYKRSQVRERFCALLTDDEMNSEAFRRFLEESTLRSDNLYEYLDEREIAMLSARWPQENWKNAVNDEIGSRWMLDHLEGTKSNIDWKVFANLCKSLSLIRFGRVRLHEDAYETTMKIHVDTIVRYVFGDEG